MVRITLAVLFVALALAMTGHTAGAQEARPLKLDAKCGELITQNPNSSGDLMVVIGHYAGCIAVVDRHSGYVTGYVRATGRCERMAYVNTFYRHYEPGEEFNLAMGRAGCVIDPYTWLWSPE